MAVLQEYKCPCCGGAIAFDSTAQKMKCPYCDTKFEIETLQAYDEVLQTEQPDKIEWTTSAEQEWKDGETDSLRSYVCKSCGGKIIGDATTAATSCPFCGNPVVIMEQFSGTLRPDLVVPFKLDKNAAKEAMKKHYRGKKLLPKVFQDENHIDEVKGLYVPVWLFDADANASIRYRATRVRTWHDRNYDYTETQHFSILRSGSLGFEAVPVDGSTKMPDDMMESIEPFDLSDAVDFQTAYLVGFFADKYDVDSNQSISRANERVQASAEDAFLGTVSGYLSVTPEHTNLQLSNGKIRYALYPVWLLNTTWNGKRYQFIMNGQTGKFAGDLPVDKGLARKYFGATVGIVAAAVIAARLLLWLL